jgi:hypothetical protein
VEPGEKSPIRHRNDTGGLKPPEIIGETEVYDME